MNPLNPLFAIFVLLIAYITGRIIILTYKRETTIGRYQTIDGLRGFLALSVFIHHSSIWYHFIQTGGAWDAPKSNLYNQLGKTSVTLFFMITSFLFVSKLLNTKEKEFNWRYFFRSRIVRIAPMYYFSVLLIFFIVMLLSGWKMNIGIKEFIGSVFNWFVFLISGDYKINNCEVTGIINAGVTWSLSYELLFYFSLPTVALFILKIKPKMVFVFISIVFILLFYFIHSIDPNIVYSFLGGAIAPILLKYTPLKNKAEHVLSSIIVLICFLSIGGFENTDSNASKVFITIVFTYIALGNSLFGLLKSPTLKLLGDISYSTYLLHGIILFAVFYLGIGLEKTKQYSASEFCIIIFLITPIVVLISFLGYRFIEKPFMDKYNKNT